jgi:hypothetical protein
MKSFKIFFERKIRNPLRKKELGGRYDNKKWVEQEKKNLPDSEKEKIQRMIEYGVEPERIEVFKQAKEKEHADNLKRLYLRDKIEDPKILFVKYGIKVFVDKYSNIDISKNSKEYNKLLRNVTKLIIDYKDVIPNRKPRIVVTNISKNPLIKNTTGFNKDVSFAGVYNDRIIYLDDTNIDDFDTLIHEYAHFLEDRVPPEFKKYLITEYQKILDEYFTKIEGIKTKRQSLEKPSNIGFRKKFAKSMGLPSDYAAVNHREWFAEMITHWKKMPNNPVTYRLKKIIKTFLNRV